MDIHVRQQIRETFFELLNGLPSTGDAVYLSRSYDLESKTIPALIIYTTSEASQRDTVMRSNGVDRLLDVVVQGYAKGKTTDDQLDQIALEVEKAIAEHPKLLGIAQDTQLINTNSDLVGEGNSQAGAITLVFQVHYRTTQTEPETAI